MWHEPLSSRIFPKFRIHSQREMKTYGIARYMESDIIKVSGGFRKVGSLNPSQVGKERIRIREFRR
jgi:hypothetical protein